MFKKTIIAGIFATSTAAFAGSSVTVGYADRETSSGAKVDVYSLSVKTSLGNSGIDGDIGVAQSIAETTNAITNRTELGLSKSFSTGTIITPTVRTAVGMKNKSGSESVSYYAVETGLNLKITDSFSARVAYRYRDAFDVADADRSNTNRYSISYALTKNDKLTLGYDNLRGDGANKQTSLSYTRSF